MARVDRDRPDALSMAEMLRIMDVATAIRQDRELVEEQLNVGALRERLKDRMIAAARVTGEAVTPEEVDAAIRRYFASMYTFREPRLSLKVAFAHLWVRRRPILWVGSAALGAATLAWSLFLAPRAPLSESGRVHRRVEGLAREVSGLAATVRSIATDKDVGPEVARLTSEAEVYRVEDDPKGLDSVRQALVDMDANLREDYTVTVVSGSNRRSAIERPYIDPRTKERSPGYYVIVEARRPDGSTVPRRIRNAETDQYETVKTWGERVPEAVYRRLKKDKAEDHILNETTFAAKRRGVAAEQVTMPGADGKPLTRLGQITKW